MSRENSYAPTDAAGLVPADRLGTGSDGSGTHVLADDQTWQPVGTGPTGARGLRGAPGYAEDGEDGLTIVGRRGATGAAGGTGAAGARGLRGTTGANGEDGEDGLTIVPRPSGLTQAQVLARTMGA